MSTTNEQTTNTTEEQTTDAPINNVEMTNLLMNYINTGSMFGDYMYSSSNNLNSHGTSNIRYHYTGEGPLILTSIINGMIGGQVRPMFNQSYMNEPRRPSRPSPPPSPPSPPPPSSPLLLTAPPKPLSLQAMEFSDDENIIRNQFFSYKSQLFINYKSLVTMNWVILNQSRGQHVHSMCNIIVFKNLLESYEMLAVNANRHLASLSSDKELKLKYDIFYPYMVESFRDMETEWRDARHSLEAVFYKEVPYFDNKKKSAFIDRYSSLDWVAIKKLFNRKAFYRFYIHENYEIHKLQYGNYGYMNEEHVLLKTNPKGRVYDVDMDLLESDDKVQEIYLTNI